MIRENLNWIVAVTMVIVAVGGISVYVSTDKFEVMLADGSIKAKYAEGVLKIYSGRYLAFNDDIRPYYWNGEGYITMYKARGSKYSNISYSKNDDLIYIKQDISYSQGILTRHFSIDENDIKASFEWTPEDPKLRVYFRWNFDGMDEIPEKIVYLDSSKKETYALMDFGLFNVWENEVDNTVRVERFQNGRLTIRTKIFEGSAFYDPIITLDEPKDITSFSTVIVDNCFNVTKYKTAVVPVFENFSKCWNTTIFFDCKNVTHINETTSLPYVVVNATCKNKTETSCYNYTEKVGTKEILVPYVVKECNPYVVVGEKQLNYSKQDFNCSNDVKDCVVCDSCLDGNCDGICDIRGGETCYKNCNGTEIYKNSVVIWKSTSIPVEKMSYEV